MKYYNLNGTLVVTLTTGLDLHYLLETVDVDGVHYERLYVNFTFDSPYFEDNPLKKIPLSRQQATRLYVQFLEREAVYRNCCEIWWKQNRELSEQRLIERGLQSITEHHFDVPKPVKVEQFFWRKPMFTFMYS
jgi:hypothetical protein